MIDHILDALDWTPVPFSGEPASDLPHVTHRGFLRIGEHELECLQLSNGMRVFTEESLKKFPGYKEAQYE